MSTFKPRLDPLYRQEQVSLFLSFCPDLGFLFCPNRERVLHHFPSFSVICAAPSTQACLLQFHLSSLGLRWVFETPTGRSFDIALLGKQQNAALVGALGAQLVSFSRLGARLNGAMYF